MFYVKVVHLVSTYQMLFGVCRSDVWLLKSEGGPKRPPPLLACAMGSSGVYWIEFTRIYGWKSQELRGVKRVQWRVFGGRVRSSREFSGRSRWAFRESYVRDDREWDGGVLGVVLVNSLRERVMGNRDFSKWASHFSFWVASNSYNLTL